MKAIVWLAVIFSFSVQAANPPAPKRHVASVSGNWKLQICVFPIQKKGNAVVQFKTNGEEIAWDVYPKTAESYFQGKSGSNYPALTGFQNSNLAKLVGYSAQQIRDGFSMSQFTAEYSSNAIVTISGMCGPELDSSASPKLSTAILEKLRDF